MYVRVLVFAVIDHNYGFYAQFMQKKAPVLMTCFFFFLGEAVKFRFHLHMIAVKKHLTLRVLFVAGGKVRQLLPMNTSRDIHYQP